MWRHHPIAAPGMQTNPKRKIGEIESILAIVARRLRLCSSERKAASGGLLASLLEPYRHPRDHVEGERGRSSLFNPTLEGERRGK